MGRAAAELDAVLPPFRGGAAGLFGYDLAYGLEKLPPNEAPFAIDRFACPCHGAGLYATVLAFDHETETCFIIATGLPETNPTARSDAAGRAIAAQGTAGRRAVLAPAGTVPGARIVRTPQQ